MRKHNSKIGVDKCRAIAGSLQHTAGSWDWHHVKRAFLWVISSFSLSREEWKNSGEYCRVISRNEILLMCGPQSKGVCITFLPSWLKTFQFPVPFLNEHFIHFVLLLCQYCLSVKQLFFFPGVKLRAAFRKETMPPLSLSAAVNCSLRLPMGLLWTGAQWTRPFSPNASLKVGFLPLVTQKANVRVVEIAQMSLLLLGLFYLSLWWPELNGNSWDRWQKTAVHRKKLTKFNIQVHWSQPQRTHGLL